jgi:membrane protein DedA with SNARE-associated domain
MLQAAIFVLLVIALGWAVITNMDNSADWIVFAVIILTTVGAAIAIYPRRYPGRRRTFVRHSEPPPRR